MMNRQNRLPQLSTHASHQPWWAGLLVSLVLVAGGCTSAPQSPPEVSQSPATTEAPAASTADTPTAPAESSGNNSVAVAPHAIAPNNPVNSDNLVIPGERVGPITADTTREDLVELFGAEQVRDEDIYVGEGFSEPGTVIELEDGRSLSLLWTDETRTEIAAVKDLGPAWHTPEEIGIGTSLAELQSKLGDFELYGLAWDYGGTVVLENSQLDQYDGLLILRLQPDPEAMERSPDAWQAVAGDELFSANNPNFQDLGLTVNEMIVYFSMPDEL